VRAGQHSHVVWLTLLRVGAPYCFDTVASDPSGSTGTSTLSA
jgi:hypothetical protein